ncbi:MAG: hypothetical protein Ct9H300mP4_04410 [Gammaproteobacteria bacterium]|nr:MAG: hypothetical protein Ct9H300mP4_04410 [Gammaproteobacteria bacterium]
MEVSRHNLLEWKDAEKGVPWGFCFCLEGITLAAQPKYGISCLDWKYDASGLKYSLLGLIFSALIIFLTELTSNLATTATFLPIVEIIATQFGFNPCFNCFNSNCCKLCVMLPVATPPNAIVFGSD